MATTTTNVEQLKINVMTQQQYNAATKSATELYFVTDAKVDYATDVTNKPTIPSTAADVGAVAKTGDTMSGDLGFGSSNKIEFQGTGSYKQYIQNDNTTSIRFGSTYSASYNIIMDLGRAEIKPAMNNYGYIGDTNYYWNEGYITTLNSTDVKCTTLTATYLTNNNIGNNLTIPNTAGRVAAQVTSLPTAAATEEGNIYQFIGTTTSSYINSYFYKCISDGGNPATYSWQQINVQPSSSGSSSLSTLSDVSLTSLISGQYLKYDGSNWVNDTVSYLPTANGTLVGDTTIAYDSFGSYYLYFNTETTNKVYLKTTRASLFGIGMTSGVAGYNFLLTEQCFTPNYTNKTSSLGKSDNKWTTVYTTKLNNGSDITIPNQAGKVAVQVTSFPTASSTVDGEIYQYIGTTDSIYTNGYFYQCVSDGGNPAAYSWVQLNVQPSSGGGSLPSQTGNAGKFLTTDGTDPSWSDKPLVNNNQYNSGLSINGTINSSSGSSNLAILGTISNSNSSGSSAIGSGSSARSHYATAIGASAYADYYAVAVGTNASAGETNSTAVGYGARATGRNSIQLGTGDRAYAYNSDANTFKVANGNGNFEMMSADGTIPKARLANVATVPSTTPVLTSAGWSSNSQTITVSGVTSSNVVIVSPVPASVTAYADAGIICTTQATDSLTFTCTTTPSADISLTVVIF